jgi:uncharacterized protein
MSITLRRARKDDLEQVLALNEADVRHLSPLTAPALERLAAMACYFGVAEADGRLAGFLLAMATEAGYESVNFLWFKASYASFVYVDRVVVGAHARRAGVATRLYGDLEAHARALGAPAIACEINLRPTNPDSIAFHDRHGFVPVGSQDIDGGAKNVSMRLKRL